MQNVFEQQNTANCLSMVFGRERHPRVRFVSSRPIAAKISVKSSFQANWKATAADDSSAIGSKAESSVIADREERSKKTPHRISLDHRSELDTGSSAGQDIGGAVDDKRRGINTVKG